MLEARLRSSAAIGADAKACFDQAPDQYARANVGVLAVEDEGIAREIHLLLTEEGYSFDVLARRYSIEFADPRGSHPVSRRDVWRFQLPLGIADIAFGPGLRVPCDPDPIEVGEVWRVLSDLQRRKSDLRSRHRKCPAFGVPAEIPAAPFDRGLRFVVA